MQPEPAPRSLPDRPLPAVVVNPIHVEDLAHLHTQIATVCAELGWAPPLWLETTVEDPGGGQTRSALAAGADVVLACGGDGTVRHLARVLAGSGTPLGMVPTGTANLLARNLAIVLDAPAKGTRRINPPRRVRTVVVGNCGKLLAGLVLMPAARVDDGLLDVVSIGPRGIIGWLAVAARVLGRRRHGHRIVQHWQGRTVIISTESPQQAQLDGDPVGEVRGLRISVDPGALLVRV